MRSMSSQGAQAGRLRRAHRHRRGDNPEAEGRRRYATLPHPRRLQSIAGAPGRAAAQGEAHEPPTLPRPACFTSMIPRSSRRLEASHLRAELIKATDGEMLRYGETAAQARSELASTNAPDPLCALMGRVVWHWISEPPPLSEAGGALNRSNPASVPQVRLLFAGLWQARFEDPANRARPRNRPPVESARSDDIAQVARVRPSDLQGVQYPRYPERGYPGSGRGR